MGTLSLSARGAGFQELAHKLQILTDSLTSFVGAHTQLNNAWVREKEKRKKAEVKAEILQEDLEKNLERIKEETAKKYTQQYNEQLNKLKTDYREHENEMNLQVKQELTQLVEARAMVNKKLAEAEKKLKDMSAFFGKQSEDQIRSLEKGEKDLQKELKDLKENQEVLERKNQALTQENKVFRQEHDGAMTQLALMRAEMAGSEEEKEKILKENREKLSNKTLTLDSLLSQVQDQVSRSLAMKAAYNQSILP